jgi:hypothetical protein
MIELWGMGLSGWIIYNLFLLQRESKKYDTNKNGLELHEIGIYWRLNWLSIITTLALTITIVGFHLTEELFHASLKWMGYPSQDFIRAFHLLPALFSVVIQWGITKATKDK